MTNQTPFATPRQLAPQEKSRRRRQGFWRKLFFGIFFLLFLGIIGLAVAYFGFGVRPGNVWRALGYGKKYIEERVTRTPPFGGQQQVNILVLGTDVPFKGPKCSRTDTIKLVSVNLKESRVSILSIPRDTWIDMPGHGERRINSAYSFGGNNEAQGVQYAKEAVTRLLGNYYGGEIPIHRFVRIQTGGFVNIVNALGGVEVDVEKKMDYEDPSQELYIHLTPGPQRLDGKQAMGYVRFRMDKEGDYGRIRRQDQFIHAVAAELQKPEMKSRLPRLVDPVLSMLISDLTPTDALALKQVIDKVGMSGIHTLVLPTVPVRKGRAEVVEVQDPAAAAQVVSEALDGPRTTVVVLNGTRRQGLAQEVKEQIDPEAFNVVAVGSTREPVTTSEIIAADEQSKSDAALLANQFGLQDVVNTGELPPEATFGRRTPEPPPAEITIVLGSDFAGIASAGQPAGLTVAEGTRVSRR